MGTTDDLNEMLEKERARLGDDEFYARFPSLRPSWDYEIEATVRVRLRAHTREAATEKATERLRAALTPSEVEIVRVRRRR